MDLLERTAHDILAGDEPWPTLEAAGLTRVGIAEEAGGSGGSLTEAAAVLRIAAYHAAPVPLAETAWLAGWLLAETGIEVPPGRLALMTGTGPQRVPWASGADHLVVLADGAVAVVDPKAARLTPGQNLAGEPRDQVLLPEPPRDWTATHITEQQVRCRGALARAVQISGAARRALELSVAYASEREQFGRPIAHFQAVQHLLAELAGEVAVLDVAARAAVTTPESATATAAAKANASRAAGAVARIAHQVQGAIGITEEHPLHRLTLRLWSWREEYGGEAYWESHLGALPADPWHTITTA